MMLLFLVEENVLTFFHDFKSVNIDLDLEVFNSIQSLSIGDEYVIRGGAFGDTTVRRVHYNFSNGLCIVGEKVFYVLPNGDVDFERQIFTCHSLIYAAGDGDCFTFGKMKPVKPKAFSLHHLVGREVWRQSW